MNLMLPSILAFAIDRCSSSSGVSGPSFSNAVNKVQKQVITKLNIQPNPQGIHL
jgi:hypothetical protein